MSNNKNRKQQILDLEAVSKCKKQKSTNSKRIQNRKLSSNIQLIHDLDEEYLQPEIPHSSAELDDKRQSDIAYQSRDFEDSNLTKHIYEQLLIIKVILMVLAVLSILLSRIGDGSDQITIFSLKGDCIVLFTHSLLTSSIIVIAILKHVKTRELNIKQLIRFSPYQLNILGINKLFIFELLFLTIHPNFLFLDMSVSMKEPVNEQFLRLKVNNILQIIMLFRVYLIYSAIVSSTIYLSTRGSRICRIYGTKCDLYFGFKCLFNTRPLFFLIVIFISMLFVFGQMVRLSEEGVLSGNLGKFQNSLWCVMITMGTVGYGDYYPQTYIGRILLFFASITGIIVASLLILTLSTYLSMELSQNKAHITMHRLVLRDKLQQLAKGVIHQATSISKLGSLVSNKNANNKSERQLKDLKKKTDDVKYTLRKIKNLIDTDNVNEQMDRLFETLQDNMKDAYLNQVKYAAALQQMQEVQAEKIDQMKFSFTQQIQNIIKDR